jgi:hypothetical protein
MVPRSAFWIDVWEERDRLSIIAYRQLCRRDLVTGLWVILTDRDPNTSKLIAEWWDDDARSMFEDGFFHRRDLTESVYTYCASVGLLAEVSP